MQHSDWIGAPVARERLGRTERELRVERLRAAATHPALPAWFAVRVWTGREKIVEKLLADLAVEALVPMRMGPELRRRGRVIPPQPMPAIHGYVLVRLPFDRVVLSGLLGVEWVIAVVGGADAPLALSADEVFRFKGLADAGLLDWARPVGVRFRRGEKARLVAGLFGGGLCEVVSCRADGQGDAVVLVDLLGRQVPMTVPLAILEKL